MGVSGSGKSTVAATLVDRLGWEFAEGDDFHPPANVEKMRAGQPLDDDDRWPWLRSVAAWIGVGVVIPWRARTSVRRAGTPRSAKDAVDKRIRFRRCPTRGPRGTAAED